jgi:hypothetical protein
MFVAVAVAVTVAVPCRAAFRSAYVLRPFRDDAPRFLTPVVIAVDFVVIVVGSTDPDVIAAVVVLGVRSGSKIRSVLSSLP